MGHGNQLVRAIGSCSPLLRPIWVMVTNWLEQLGQGSPFVGAIGPW